MQDGHIGHVLQQRHRRGVSGSEASTEANVPGFNKLVALNLLILALVTTGAIRWVTFMICMPVLTVVPTAVSTFTKKLALTYRNLVR